jgi:ferritin
MNYLLMAENGIFSLNLISNLCAEDSLIFLIALDREKLASEFDTHLKKIVKEAEGLQSQLKLKGVESKLLIEWGNPSEVLATCLAREQAIHLK